MPFLWITGTELGSDRYFTLLPYALPGQYSPVGPVPRIARLASGETVSGRPSGSVTPMIE